MESIRAVVGSLWQSLGFWKALAVGLALLNLKNLPMVWHIRVYRYFFQYGYLLTPAVRQPPLPSTRIFKPKSLFTRAPILELDFNMHKSNSTYFTDLDVSRTALMSSIVVKGAALLEKQLKAEGKTGYLGFILGSVYTNFKREIPAYQKYEVQSHVASFDEKWIYIVTYFLKPQGKGKGKSKGDPEEVHQKRLFAVSISKYVLKKGRYTVPPRDAFEAAGYTPILAPPANGVVNGDASGVDAGANGSVTQRKETGSDAWDHHAEWEKIEKEVLEGKKMVQPFIDVEENLLQDYKQKLGSASFS